MLSTQENQESQEVQRNPGIGQAESVLAFTAALGAGFLAREFVKSGWRSALKREPPKNPTSAEVAWKDALLWGTASGAAVGLVRILARRGASQVYRHYNP